MGSGATIDIDIAIEGKAGCDIVRFNGNGAGGVMAEQYGFHACPVDGVVELLHELDAAVLFQAGGHGEIGEIQVAGGLFESHAHLLV